MSRQCGAIQWLDASGSYGRPRDTCKRCGRKSTLPTYWMFGNSPAHLRAKLLEAYPHLTWDPFGSTFATESRRVMSFVKICAAQRFQAEAHANRCGAPTIWV